MHEAELAETPPPEFFLAAYFRGMGWWAPPEQERDEAADEPIGEALPEFEP